MRVVVTGSVRAARPSRPRPPTARAGRRAPRSRPPAAAVVDAAPYEGAP